MATRSSALIALVGGSGFLGRHLVEALVARGSRVRIVARRPGRGAAQRPLGSLGQIEWVAADCRDAAAMARALAGCDGAVYLVGAFAGDLDGLQGRGAGAVAAAAYEAGVATYVHVSAIGADAGSPVAYARTKAQGEAAVRAAHPQAVIVRPSVVFGADDRFLNLFAGLIATLPVVPVFAPDAAFQPVHVDDVAAGIATLLETRDHDGQTFEFAGPAPIAVLELNRLIARASRRQPVLLALPDAVSAAFATLTGWLPGAPLSRDQWRLLRAGNVASGTLPGLAELGIVARPLGLELDRWLARYRPQGRFHQRSRSA